MDGQDDDVTVTHRISADTGLAHRAFRASVRRTWSTPTTWFRLIALLIVGVLMAALLPTPWNVVGVLLMIVAVLSVVVDIALTRRRMHRMFAGGTTIALGFGDDYLVVSTPAGRVRALFAEFDAIDVRDGFAFLRRTDSANPLVLPAELVPVVDAERLRDGLARRRRTTPDR